MKTGALPVDYLTRGGFCYTFAEMTRTSAMGRAICANPWQMRVLRPML